MIDTKGLPPSVAAVMTPAPEPQAGLTLAWQFAAGGAYTITVRMEDFHYQYKNDEDGWWGLRTADGRDVRVYERHVAVFESRNVVIRPRKSANDA